LKRSAHIRSSLVSAGQDQPLWLPLAASEATLDLVGGKGASLARLAAAGFRIPDGFHLTTAAYWRLVASGGLQARIVAAAEHLATNDPIGLERASATIRGLFEVAIIPDGVLAAIVAGYESLGPDERVLAVRSSATAEDLPGLSFAGQQDTVLGVRGEAALVAAVRRCWASLWTARALAYRARQGIPPGEVALAVLVQVLVPAEAAGVLFTADPVTGSPHRITINAAWGLGESLVGGQVTPDTLVVDRSTGALVQQIICDKTVMTVPAAGDVRQVPVPADQRRAAALTAAQAAELAALGLRIEALSGRPMDVEWALVDGRLAILQARPITGPATEEWNDSLLGDYLWTSSNLGEAAPSVMTPCTWSLVQALTQETLPLLYGLGVPPVGNIGGRPYMNLSLAFSLGVAFGVGRRRFLQVSEEVFGRIPDDLEIPRVPFSRWRLLRRLAPGAVRLRLRVRANERRLPAFLAAAAARCQAIETRVETAAGASELAALWHAELWPFYRECCHMLEAAARRDGNALVHIRAQLRRLVDEGEANALMSGLHAGGAGLASLGPLLGLERLARGEIDRAEYARAFGHRGPDELEVSSPRPAEDPAWIDRELAGLQTAPAATTTMLERQREAQLAAWARLRRRHPRRAARLGRNFERAAAAFRDREAARSEVVRAFWALRAFVQRAGALTDCGEDVFYLSIHEILLALGGDRTPLAAVAARRAAYARYRALPPYPVLIRGSFDPVAWAADPDRRTDVFDGRAHVAPRGDEALRGFPGAPGVAEGSVRVLRTAAEGEQLQPGEVLVTTVTNVGWTPLFPRAGAIVTDVGAPLSHAAIVARELGIPAVVGCGSATARLRTGDRVRVDGRQGTVYLLTRAS
jgi:rifampicin phosphotransferase